MISPDRMEQDFMEDVFVQDDLCPTIAEHALQCDSRFRTCMAIPEIAQDPSVMDDQLGALYAVGIKHGCSWATPRFVGLQTPIQSNVGGDYTLAFGRHL